MIVPETNPASLIAKGSPTMPAPMVTLQRFAYAPSNDDFFSKSCNGISLASPPTRFLTTTEGRPVPDLAVEMRGLEGRKKGDFGIGGALPVGVFFVEFMIS